MRKPRYNRAVNWRDWPKAAIDSKNAPHSTMQLGAHNLPKPDNYSRQQVRALLRQKAKDDINRLRFTDGRYLTRAGKAVAADTMVKRWMVQITKALEGESLVKGYPKGLIDRLIGLQNVHEDVVNLANSIRP
jgi:hypothetical protein